jgi:hypothetical protein
MNAASLLLLAALLALAPAAGADETARAPAWSVENLMPSGADDPKGWTVREADDGPDGLGYEALDALGRGAGLDGETFYAEFRVFESKDGACGVAMLDVDEKVEALSKALAEKAAALGWEVHGLGSPTRLLVLSGPEGPRAALAQALRERTLYAFCEMARARLRALNEMLHRNDRQIDEAHAAVAEYVDAIRAIEPEAGVGHSLYAVRHVRNAYKDPKKPDANEIGLAIASLSKALRSGVRYPPEGEHFVWAAGTLGDLLVEKRQPDLLEDAIFVLEQAVAHEAEARDNGRRVENRWNLTRALARRGRIDDAFGMLEKTLEHGKAMLPAPSYRHVYDQIKEKDELLAGLRGDPRFSKLMSDHAPKDAKKPGPPPPK